jgi:hypothetical protein
MLSLVHIDESLMALIEQAKAQKLSAGQLRAQREAFVLGNLPRTNQATRADVRKALAKIDEA